MVWSRAEEDVGSRGQRLRKRASKRIVTLDMKKAAPYRSHDTMYLVSLKNEYGSFADTDADGEVYDVVRGFYRR